MDQEAPEKPLHVLVAEALGWQALEREQAGDTPEDEIWFGLHPDGEDCEDPDDCSGHLHGDFVPFYHDDWTEIGRLIEKYEISLAPDQTLPGTWGAWVGDFAPLSARASNPLVAVCSLILILKEVGRL